MLVIKVDRLNPQPAQACFARAADVVGPAVHAPRARVGGIANDSEFRGQHDLVALALNRAAHKFLVLERPVNIGRVKKRDAEFERPMNGRDRFVVIASGIELRHAHAAQAESRNFETGMSKIAGFH